MAKKVLFGFTYLTLLVSCQNAIKQELLASQVRGQYKAVCLQEAVTDLAQADTSLMITIDKDSIKFSRQRLANCCGWFNSIGLRLSHDTLKLVDNDQDAIRNVCDCICLFQEAIIVDRSFYDSIKVIDFGGRLIDKQSVDVK